jgi:hypothetical protein
MPGWHLKRGSCRRSEVQQIEAPAGATRDGEGSSGRHRDLEPVRLLKAMSIARSIGAVRLPVGKHGSMKPGGCKDMEPQG